MGNALWLILALPQWYFSSLLTPLAAGPLTLAPAVGALAFIAGVVDGVAIRQRRLFLFLIPFVFSEALVGIAGLLRGAAGGTASNFALVIFLVTQAALSGWLVYRVKGSRIPAAALAIFTLTYAAFAAFVATMSFSDTWL